MFLLQINGEIVAGYNDDKAAKVIRKAPGDRISLAVRDRPFERTITMQKDSSNHVGFSYNNCLIKAIIKDSSAARYVYYYMFCTEGHVTEYLDHVI